MPDEQRGVERALRECDEVLEWLAEHRSDVSQDRRLASQGYRMVQRLAHQLAAKQEECDRLRSWLEKIEDPSYVGNYAPLEVVEIYRKWAALAIQEDADA
jgi:hypothetical protein